MSKRTNSSLTSAIPQVKDAAKISGDSKRKLNKTDLEALNFAAQEENRPQLIELMLQKLQKTDPKHATPKAAVTAAIEMRNVALMRLKELEQSSSK